MFKLQISSIFNFDQAHQSKISGLLGVKNEFILWLEVANRLAGKAVFTWLVNEWDRIKVKIYSVFFMIGSIFRIYINFLL